MSFLKQGLFAGSLVLLLSSSPGDAQSSPAASTTSTPEPGPGSDASSYVNFGISNGAKGDLDGAITAFNQAMQIDPNYAPAYYNRGLAYSLENKPEDAMTDFSRSIQLAPKFRDAYYHRGNLEGQKGDFDHAISDFNEVITLDPKYAPAHYNLGHVRYFKGDLDGALTELDQALTLEPNSPYSHFIRGLIEHAQGHRVEATRDFQLSLGFGFPGAAYWVWISEMESGERGVATQDLSDALNKPGIFKPDDWPVQIANLLLQKTPEDELIAKAKTSNPTEVSERLCEAWFYSGVIKRFSGDVKGAEDCFTQAIATGATGAEEYVEANRELAELKAPLP